MLRTLAMRCEPSGTALARTGFSAQWQARYGANSRHNSTDASHDTKDVESKILKPSAGSFESLLASSAFVRAGDTYGRQVTAKVVGIKKNKLKLDLGTKFYSYVPIPTKASSFRVGDEVTVMVRSVDYVEHVTGDAKPISIYEGDVSFVRAGGSDATQNLKPRMELQRE